MKWNDHIDYITDKVSRRVGILRLLKYKVTRNCLRTIYISHIRSILEYCDIVWDSCSGYLALQLEKLQRECLRIITGLPVFCNLEKLYTASGFDTLMERRRQHRLILLFKASTLGKCPSYFRSIIPTRINEASRHDRRVNIFEPYPHTIMETFRQSFFPATANEWNYLPVEARSATSLYTFKRLIRPPEIPVPSILQLPRYPSVLYTRLACKCSSLNAHLFHANLALSAMCACNSGIEDNFHFFYNCPFYDTHRERLMYELDQLGLRDLSLPILLHSDVLVPKDTIPRIQSIVFRYILATRRFQ